MNKDLPSNAQRPRAFEDQVLEHMDALYAAALKLTRNSADAEDLRQDALVRALRFYDKFEPGTYIRAWLLTILRNTFINDYRKRVRRPVSVELSGQETKSLPIVDRDMGHFPYELARGDLLELLGDDVREAVESLPEGHRRTLIMADLQDFSYKEIAAALDCPLGTVMSRLHRGRRLVRASLAAHKKELAFN